MSSCVRLSSVCLSHWDPYAMHRGGCLELYYCNMVEWCWWDSSLIWKTSWFPSVLWHCWFGHMWPVKIVPDMTYNVSSGMLSLYTTTTVCLSSVCNVRAPYADDWNLRQFFYAVGYLSHLWPFDKNCTEIVPGEPLRRGVKPKRKSQI